MAWQQDMENQTAALCRVGRYKLPRWGMRDNSNRGLETLQVMSQIALSGALAYTMLDPESRDISPGAASRRYQPGPQVADRGNPSSDGSD